MHLTFRKTTDKDFENLKALYTDVAQNPRGVARNPMEITDAYILSILSLNKSGGLSMLALDGSVVVAEIHAGCRGIAIFNHLLAYLTVGVLTTYQGKGVGGALFKTFLSEVALNRKDIYRVELESRASNKAGIKLYTKMGFVVEGRMVNQTRNLDGTHEDGIMMAWFNPSYERQQDI